MKNANLILHCGADKVEFSAVKRVKTPKATDSWCPIPHHTFIEQVEGALNNANMRVTGSAHSLTKEGARYFGLLQVSNHQENEDYCYVLGLRNSHDKSYPAGIVVGSEVFVCDNLGFMGEITVVRKHTTNIMRDLPILTTRAVGMLGEKWTSMTQRIDLYKTTEMSDLQAHDFMIRSIEQRVAPVRQLDTIIREWKAPRHPEFASAKNAWRLYNAFTEAAKEGSLGALPNRTISLHGMMDGFVGFKTASGVEGLNVEDAAITRNN
jgi:hypothetical protein